MKYKIRYQDIIAGLSIAGLLLPVAYSNIANLPPQAGIIALFAGLFCYALIRSSWFAIVSATSSSAAVLAAAIVSITFGKQDLRVLFAAGIVILAGVYFFTTAYNAVGEYYRFYF